ncbi:MAG: NAD(P)/FAD-dependent oxidoreductase [Armatimonadota bacterium]
MSYDFDVIVIGAGPAGMAAAIRCRWVKTANAVPASVLLLDPAGLGGLARMGTINLTGPSFHFEGPELMAKLFPDIEQFEVPLLREAATGIRREDPYWIVRTPERELSCLAVVVATGIRRLTDEGEAFKAKKMSILAGGYERAAERFITWSHEHAGQRLVIVGGEPLQESLSVFQAFDNGRNTIEGLYEPRQLISRLRIADDQLVISYEEGGGKRELACDKAMLDYHTLLEAPPSPAILPAELRDVAGYSRIGPQGDSALPGLFAAGDCTGFPSMSLRAMAQGAEAGFNAYRHVYEYKFGDQPPLFAFYVLTARPPLTASEMPEIDPGIHLPVGLSQRSRFAAHPLVSTSEEQSHRQYLSQGEMSLLMEELAEKIATVHRR